jgi:hypothetical protein
MKFLYILLLFTFTYSNAQTLNDSSLISNEKLIELANIKQENVVLNQKILIYQDREDIFNSKIYNDSLAITFLTNKVQLYQQFNNQEKKIKWYETKYFGYASGMITVLISSFILKNINE